jgi:hypothetical protein
MYAFLSFFLMICMDMNLGSHVSIERENLVNYAMRFRSIKNTMYAGLCKLLSCTTHTPVIRLEL